MLLAPEEQEGEWQSLTPVLGDDVFTHLPHLKRLDCA